MQKAQASFADIFLKVALQILNMMTTVKEIGAELDLKTPNDFLKGITISW